MLKLVVDVEIAFTVITVKLKLTQPLKLVTVYVIVEVPADTPVTTPPDVIDATAVLLLFQTPLAVDVDKFVVEFTHRLFVPVIAATAGGKAFTVIDFVAVLIQPFALLTVYVIVENPTAIPVTTPVKLLTVAIDVLLLVQTPPVVVLAYVVVAPTQTAFAPVMAATIGKGFMVMVFVTVVTQPKVVTV